MLAIEPSDFITFEAQDKETKVIIKCIAKIPVTYKIQTTSPEKFRVRPRCGVLGPNESAQIGIWLKSDHSLSEELGDKFLIMGMPTATKFGSPAEVADLWSNKPANCPDVEQHRLVCRAQLKSVLSSGANKQQVMTRGNNFDMAETLPLNDHAKDMQAIKNRQYLLMGVVGILAMLVFYLVWQSLNSGSTRTAFKCHK